MIIHQNTIKGTCFFLWWMLIIFLETTRRVSAVQPMRTNLLKKLLSLPPQLLLMKRLKSLLLRPFLHRPQNSHTPPLLKSPLLLLPFPPLLCPKHRPCKPLHLHLEIRHPRTRWQSLLSRCSRLTTRTTSRTPPILLQRRR